MNISMYFFQKMINQLKPIEARSNKRNCGNAGRWLSFHHGRHSIIVQMQWKWIRNELIDDHLVMFDVSESESGRRISSGGNQLCLLLRTEIFHLIK